jgi:hypothetical protein
VSHLAVMIELAPFKGKLVSACFRDINEVARAHGLTVNIMDPDFNTASIDEEPRRLNVRTDRAGVVKSFTIG